MPGILDISDGWDGSGGLGNGGGGTDTGDPGTTSYTDPIVPETGTLQILLGEGPMEGLVDGLKSVFLDGTPIQNSDGSFNFKGVALALVAGTNTQAHVDGVTAAESETAVGVKVTFASPVTRTITSNPSGVRVRIAVPSLKVIDTTTGDSRGHSVSVKIERQNAGWNGGAWENVPLGGPATIAGGPFSSKLTRSYRVDFPITGAWQVRVTRLSADDADIYHQSETWWEAYTEVTDAKLRYPDSAVLSIRVNAKQFRSIPQVNVEMKGLNSVQIPDPAHISGGIWDGTFTTGWTDNPAWIFYDVATKTRYGAGSFLSTSGLDKWALYNIGLWCDQLVPDGKGGTEKRMACNLYLQGQQNAIRALGNLASIFWGIVYYASGLVTPIPDADSDPVALFTNANVVGGKFTYQGTARQARHTACIVKFQNPELGYAQDTAVYEDEEGIARYGYNVLDLQGVGCTSQGQALRLARWAVLTELLADETITFASGLEGSTVFPGEVIQVADQFRAGNTRAGGRLLGATASTVTLDGPVDLGAGTYTLRVQTAAGMESTEVATVGPVTTEELEVVTPFSSTPAAGAGWLLQEGTTSSLWRVLSVRKGDGLTHEVTALLHDPAKYALLELGTGDVIPRNPVTYTSPAVTGISMDWAVRVLDDHQVITLEVAWALDGAVRYFAQASRDYGPWEDMVVAGASAILDGIQPGNWRVRVCGDWRDGGLSPWAEVSGTITPPGNVPPWIADANAAASAALAAANSALDLAPVVVTDHSAIALPSSSYPAGKLVFQTSDNTLWQVNGAGTGWQTPSVQSTAIIGQLVAGQIAAGAIGASALAADIIMTNVFRSTGYTAGTSSAAPYGVKMAGAAFTTTFLDGTTDANCFMEVGGSVNIGGLRAATIANRVKGNKVELSGAGTQDIDIPEGVTEVEVTLQAPGGNGANSYGKGGGGGQYIRAKITVKPHNRYRLTGGTVGSSDTTFSWVSFDGTSGFTSDSTFATITATRGANGTASYGGVNGTSAPTPYEGPEGGWNVPGGTGGEGSPAASGVNAGKGGDVGAKLGGNGAVPTATKNAGGGGGASAMANGGTGGLEANNGGNGSLGSGGGGGNTGGAGGSSYARVRW